MDTRSDRSDSIEPPNDQGADSGAFFQRYAPRESPDDNATNKFFRRYVPSQSGPSNVADEQPEPDRVSLAEDSQFSALASDQQLTRPKSSHTRPAVFVILGLIGIAVLVAIPYLNQRPAPSEASSSPSIEDASANSESLFDESRSSLVLNNSERPLKRGQVKLARPMASNSPPFLSLWLTDMLARARDFESRGMLTEAEQMYRSILSRLPNERTSQFSINRIQDIFSTRQREEMARTSRETGLKRFRQGDYQGAEPELAVAVNLGRIDTATLYALGMSYLKLGNYPKAYAAFDHCITGNTNYAPALVGLAQVRLFAGDKEQALSLLNRALQLGGGAEFTPIRIREMISGINSKATAPPK